MTTHHTNDQRIHVYSLGHGLFPLDWELCFQEIDEYKAMLARKYEARQESYLHMIGSLDTIYTAIDQLLTFAMKDLSEYGAGAILRCPPMITALPRGDHSSSAEFVIILKLDQDGETLVYSPLPLDYLNHE